MDRQSSVHAVRRDMIASLDALSSLLGDVRGHLLTVNDRTGALITAQQEPVPGVTHIPELAGDLAKAMRHWSASMANGTSRMLLRETRTLLNGLTRIRIFFQFLATITSIQISRSRSGQLSAFVGALRGVSAQIETELAQAQSGLDAFEQSFEAILAVAREGADHLDPAARRLTEILAPIVAGQAQMTGRRHRVTAQAQELSGRIEQVIARLVGTFQFSDSAAQRLEHVETILARAGARPPGPERAAFERLAAAQLQGLERDTGDVLVLLEDSFQTIEGLGGGFVAELAAQRAEVEPLLAAQDRAFGQLNEALGTVMPMLQGIIARSAGFEGQIDLLHQRLDNLAGIGQTIGLAGVNSHLEAARAEVGQKELTYIAMSVKETAQQALKTFADTGRTLDRLRKSFDTGEFSALQDGMNRLEGDLGQIATGLEQARARQGLLSRLEDETRTETAALARLAISGRQMTSALVQTILRIEALGALLREGLGATPDLSCLDEISPIYTMDREREIHAEVMGLPFDAAGFGAADLASAAAQDTLDSILF
ncbi:hypothetical protein H9N28_11390 [Rhodobacter capsulatus]|uniref:hypothetical protein n=1 Tax=Rhodobacter capsulatus TaxID=1061 RepID=UPI0006DCC8AB|nr:hypothetical protein [Rhodobacter capsulatus]KQB12053.1 hypothetical protein AP071_08895 [Rhodobacter capsulatus]PZX22153.1 hypothetical protein LY44_03150 [Rhodobacter capsulatus]QNR62188.1 hypothetical protein H9N28_11390 [Rhodobacter capsulatus]